MAFFFGRKGEGFTRITKGGYKYNKNKECIGFDFYCVSENVGRVIYDLKSKQINLLFINGYNKGVNIMYMYYDVNEKMALDFIYSRHYSREHIMQIFNQRGVRI